MLSDEDVTQRAGSLQAMTSLTQQAFETLRTHFKRVLLVYLQDRTIDGQPRTSRHGRSYEHCP